MSDSTYVGSEAIAYPTIGVILLGGLSDSENRIPRHTSAGFAYSTADLEAYSKTRLFFADKSFGVFNGKLVEEGSSRSPLAILKKYNDQCKCSAGKKLAFFSENRGIISGSSDSGAAAMAMCVRNMFGIDDTSSLERDFRRMSESIGRSLLGGLTITVADGVTAKTERLLGPEAFQDYSVVAFKFSSERHPSDRIHENIVNNPSYEDRIRRASRKGDELRSLASENNVKGIFELAMHDTDEYHELVEASGVQVINDSMRSLITRIRQEIRFWKTYIVTGGTNVFVPCLNADVDRVRKLGEGLASGVKVLKVAGKANGFVKF